MLEKVAIRSNCLPLVLKVLEYLKDLEDLGSLEFIQMRKFLISKKKKKVIIEKGIR